MYRKPTHIIMHDSLTADGQTVSWGAIREYHIKEKGYMEIAYHAGIELIGNRYEILTGRMLGREGSHCPGYNRFSMGICLIGNFEENPIPFAQWDLAIQFVAHMAWVLQIPKENIMGHREAMPNRTCPHKNFDCVLFREYVWEYQQRNEWEHMKEFNNPSALA